MNDLQIRINRIGHQLSHLAGNLEALGYRFDNPEGVLPGVEVGAAAAIARLEQDAGRVPLALKQFWTTIGSVDFTGHHPDWDGCDYPDPILIYPPSVAIAELDEFLADIEEATRFGGRYLIPIAPDALHKADVSGGMWYNIDIPAVADDPPLNDEPHATTFIHYLEVAIAFGGFPGLEAAPDHTWPLEQIKRGL